MLQTTYVSKEHKLIPKSSLSGSSVHEHELLNPGQPCSHRHIAIHNLTTKGFVFEGRISDTGISFVKACTKESRLAPSTFGYKEWTNQFVAIISYDLGDVRTLEVATRLEAIFRQHRIKSQTVAITRTNSTQPLIDITHGLLLLSNNAKTINENAQYLQAFSEKRPLVVMHLSEACATLPHEIKVNTTIAFSPNIDAQLQEALNALLYYKK